MSILSRLRGTKKAKVDEKKTVPSSVPEGPKPSKRTAAHFNIESRNVPLPANADPRHQMKKQYQNTSKLNLNQANSDIPLSMEVKPVHARSASDVAVPSVPQQLVQSGQRRKSSRYSSFDSSNRRPPFARRSSSLVRRRSTLDTTIVEEDVSETSDDSTYGSLQHETDPSSASSLETDSLQLNRMQLERDLHKPQHDREVQSELANTSRHVHHRTSAIEKSVNGSGLYINIPSASSPERAYAEEQLRVQSPKLRLPPIFQTAPPALNGIEGSPGDNSFGLCTASSTEVTKELSEKIKSRVQQRQSKVSAVCASLPKNASRHQSEYSVSQRLAIESRKSSMETLSRAYRQSRTTKSLSSTPTTEKQEPVYIARQEEAYNTVLGHLYPRGKAFAESARPDSLRHLQHAHRLSHQAHSQGSRSSSLSPDRGAGQRSISTPLVDVSNAQRHTRNAPERGRPVLAVRTSFPESHNYSNQIQNLSVREPHEKISPPREENHDKCSNGQAWKGEQAFATPPYQGKPDGTVHISRYPSLKRNSYAALIPSYDEWESQYDQDCFPFQQDSNPTSSRPPPIPVASKPVMPPGSQTGFTGQASQKRHHTFDAYGHSSAQNQTFDQRSQAHSRTRSAAARYGSFDSYGRAANDQGTRASYAIDDRVAKAHMERSRRQPSNEEVLNFEQHDQYDHTFSPMDHSQQQYYGNKDGYQAQFANQYGTAGDFEYAVTDYHYSSDIAGLAVGYPSHEEYSQIYDYDMGYQQDDADCDVVHIAQLPQSQIAKSFHAPIAPPARSPARLLSPPIGPLHERPMLLSPSPPSTLSGPPTPRKVSILSGAVKGVADVGPKKIIKKKSSLFSILRRKKSGVMDGAY